uniref:Uncharacterized protein n=1 Tax=Ixodes ricinus TaxID=34613 RepID=A0A147BUG0_IXORI
MGGGGKCACVWVCLQRGERKISLMMMVLMVVIDRGTGSDVGRRRFTGSRGLRLVGGVVTNPVPPLDGHQVAALVEDDSPVAYHALLEGAHDLAAVVRDPVAAVEAHLAVVGPVPVAHQETRRVELGEAVVPLVARDLAQHAARDVALVLPTCCSCCGRRCGATVVFAVVRCCGRRFV